MKFIRDIIADKRDQVPSQPAQPTEAKADHDIMASILSETTSPAESFQLDSSYQVSPPKIEDAPEPDFDAFVDTDHSQLSQDNWDSHASDDTAPLGGLEPDAFQAPSNPQPEVFITDAPPEPPQREFKRFTRTQTRLHNPAPEPQAAPQPSPDPAPRQVAEPPRPPAQQHAAPIRRRVMPAPEAAVEAMLDRDLSEPHVQPKPQPQPTIQPQREMQPEIQPEMRVEIKPEPPQQPAAPSPPADVAAPQPIDVPSPAMGRGSSRAGRVKTRLLGFDPRQAAGADPIARSSKTPDNGYTEYPVGWLTVIKGPGRGAAFTLFSGVTIIGRGEDQTLRLDFGDNSISRDTHAAIAFDSEQNSFFIGHGGKANLVRRNNRPVLSTEELDMGDVIRIGETTLRFVPLCGAEFGWNDAQQSDAGHAT